LENDVIFALFDIFSTFLQTTKICFSLPYPALWLEILAAAATAAAGIL